MPTAIIDGITTNPSLLAKEPGDYREILKKIAPVEGADYVRSEVLAAVYGALGDLDEAFHQLGVTDQLREAAPEAVVGTVGVLELARVALE